MQLYGKWSAAVYPTSQFFSIKFFSHAWTSLIMCGELFLSRSLFSFSLLSLLAKKQWHWGRRTAGARSSPKSSDIEVDVRWVKVTSVKSRGTAGAASLPIIKDRDSLPTAGAASSPIFKDRVSLHTAGAASSPIIKHVKIPKVKNVLYSQQVLHPRR